MRLWRACATGKATAAQRKVRSELAIILFSMGVGTIDKRIEGFIPVYERFVIRPDFRICIIDLVNKRSDYATKRPRNPQRTVPPLRVRPGGIC